MMSSYYIILGDACEPESMGLSFTIQYFMAALIGFITPYQLSNQEAWKWFAVVWGCISGLATLASFFYILETHKVDKPEVSRRLSLQSDSILASVRSFGRSLSGKGKRKSSNFSPNLKFTPSELDSDKGSMAGFEAELESPKDSLGNPSFERRSSQGSHFKRTNTNQDKYKNSPIPKKSKMSYADPKTKSVEDLDHLENGKLEIAKEEKASDNSDNVKIQLRMT